ncbi:Hypothetical_protein [Hexamita inflata]|uniref:Hypothetical_protein n=1 Tax=Hexamita inflata TaxID=28002 RepID=A0AA86Q7U5_9EUKA|nr:Hypothetical protein HINF_LOCUS40558 [Hexamita inflata]
MIIRLKRKSLRMNKKHNVLRPLKLEHKTTIKLNIKKYICEKQQQEILELQNKDKKSQQVIQDLQARLNYYMLQQQPVDNVQVQTDNIEQMEQVHQILQEYPEQQQQVQQEQSQQTIKVPKFIPISEKKAILQKRRWTYQGKLVHIQIAN